MQAFKLNEIRTNTHANKECQDIIVLNSIVDRRNVMVKQFHGIQLRCSPHLQIIFSITQTESNVIKSFKKMTFAQKNNVALYHL